MRRCTCGLSHSQDCHSVSSPTLATCRISCLDVQMLAGCGRMVRTKAALQARIRHSSRSLLGQWRSTRVPCRPRCRCRGAAWRGRCGPSCGTPQNPQSWPGHWRTAVRSAGAGNPGRLRRGGEQNQCRAVWCAGCTNRRGFRAGVRWAPDSRHEGYDSGFRVGA